MSELKIGFSGVGGVVQVHLTLAVTLTANQSAASGEVVTVRRFV